MRSKPPGRDGQRPTKDSPRRPAGPTSGRPPGARSEKTGAPERPVRTKAGAAEETVRIRPVPSRPGRPGAERVQLGQPRPRPVEPAPRPAPPKEDRAPRERPQLRMTDRPRSESGDGGSQDGATQDRGRPAESRRTAPPGGGVWLYGVHAVAAALANPNRRLRRLMVTPEAEAALPGQPWPITPERTDRARLDQLLGHDTVHQGVAVLADPLPPPVLTTVLERPGVLLILDQVTDPRNVGAVLRSAAAFGAAGVVAQDRNAPDESGALAKAASGALETMPLIRAVNLARTLVALKAAGFWVVGLAANARPLSGPALSQRRVALVLGAEGAGLRRLTRDTCDELAGLAMPGDMESLNVSAAASVALYELTRKP